MCIQWKRASPARVTPYREAYGDGLGDAPRPVRALLVRVIVGHEETDSLRRGCRHDKNKSFFFPSFETSWPVVARLSSPSRQREEMSVLGGKRDTDDDANVF